MSTAVNVNGDIQTIEGGVTAPRGFLAAGVHAGIKRRKKDVALVYSEWPCAAAGVFTTNRVKAAPLLVTRERVMQGPVRAVVVNSGNANACTGQRGLEDARQMAALCARALGVAEEEVLVASTGVIGVPLPMEKIA
ncbi:MAG: bifunctional ornithine acetyltransferase/N-acetylglutamate synthase, partial [Clostridia bacterium]